VPVFLNTGARAENVDAYLKIVDGLIVGSSLKAEGKTWNPIEPARVTAFMEKAKAIRGDHSQQ
jgi:hypothetical protein